LVHIIRAHTREAGLRNLEREIGRVCRKVARGITEGRTKPVVWTVEKVREYLGPDKFFSEVAERTEEPGVAVGLAWTPNGGDILFVESTRMAGKKNLTLTGHLGEVMKESAQAALSYVRSRASRLGIATVILPRRNEKDLEDVPEPVRRAMRFVFVDTVEEVLEHALEPAQAERERRDRDQRAATA